MLLLCLKQTHTKKKEQIQTEIGLVKHTLNRLIAMLSCVIFSQYFYSDRFVLFERSFKQNFTVFRRYAILQILHVYLILFK